MRSPNHNPRVQSRSRTGLSPRFADGRQHTAWSIGRGWSSENRTQQVAMTQGLQPRLCPSTRPAESPGIEPAPLRVRGFSKPLEAQPQAIQAESKGIEPSALRLARFSRPLADHSALPSKAVPPGFEPRPSGSGPLMLPLHQGTLAPLVGVEPTHFGFGDQVDAATQRYVVAQTGVEPARLGYEPSMIPISSPRRAPRRVRTGEPSLEDWYVTTTSVGHW